MTRDSFVFYASDYRSIKDMSDEQLGRFFRAICEYALNGIEKIEDKELKYAFKLLINKIKRDQAKYEDVCQRRSEAGKKAWQKQKQMLANGGDSEYESCSDSVIIEIKKIFLFEKNVLPVKNEFERFWQHYAKNNWHDGNGILITDRIACARNWLVPEAKRSLLAYQASAWRKIYDKLAKEPESHLLITDLVKIEIKNVTLIITCTSAMCKLLENHINIVKSIVSSDFHCANLTYQIVDNQ